MTEQLSNERVDRLERQLRATRVLLAVIAAGSAIACALLYRALPAAGLETATVTIDDSGIVLRGTADRSMRLSYDGLELRTASKPDAALAHDGLVIRAPGQSTSISPGLVAVDVDNGHIALLASSNGAQLHVSQSTASVTLAASDHYAFAEGRIVDDVKPGGVWHLSADSDAVLRLRIRKPCKYVPNDASGAPKVAPCPDEPDGGVAVVSASARGSQ